MEHLHHKCLSIYFSISLLTTSVRLCLFPLHFVEKLLRHYKSICHNKPFYPVTYVYIYQLFNYNIYTESQTKNHTLLKSTITYLTTEILKTLSLLQLIQNLI